MTREEARKKAEVMLAYADGADIEMALTSEYDDDGSRRWFARDGKIEFNWAKYNYRVKLTKPSIDWSHVADEYIALIKNAVSGNHSLRNHIPEIYDNRIWSSPIDGKSISAETFASFKPGTCDWKDSLVIRPGYKAEGA